MLRETLKGLSNLGLTIPVGSVNWASSMGTGPFYIWRNLMNVKSTGFNVLNSPPPKPTEGVSEANLPKEAKEG